MATVGKRTTIRAATADEALDLSARTIVAYFSVGVYPAAVVAAFAVALLAICKLTLIRASVLAGQIANETRRFKFGGQVSADQYNWAGLGATDDGAAGLRLDGAEMAVYAVAAHHGAYLFGPAAVWPLNWRGLVPLAYRLRNVLGAGYGGTVTVLGDYGAGKWATDPDYAAKVAIHANALLALEASMTTPTEATGRYIATLRARGVDVTDLRGKLPVNAKPANRYGLVRGGLGGVTKLIQHWTGDSFNRATIKQITGADYGDGTISASMSPEDERDLLTWYANYHIGKEGGTWGGIAYGTLVMPSGRVYVAWDIGTLTYHAFSVNGYSYALCCPASNGQAPTAAQLVALNHCWQVLCEETPEIPAGWGDLYGHTEARQFDAQNQTTCPGPALLAHVRKARATGAPSVTLPTQPGAGSVVEAPTAPDDPATWKTFLRDGRAILEIDFGGISTEILGASVVDAGISTKNAAGDTHDRSILSNHGMPWRKRP